MHRAAGAKFHRITREDSRLRLAREITEASIRLIWQRSTSGERPTILFMVCNEKQTPAVNETIRLETISF